MTQHAFVFENKAAAQLISGQHLGQPERVVLPHFRVGNRIQLAPKRVGFWRGMRDSFVGMSQKNGALELKSISEMKRNFRDVFGVDRCDADFFLRLANGAFGQRFAGVELAAGTVNFAHAKPAEFANEEHARAIDHETKRRSLLRNPVIPIHRRRA